MHLRTLRGRLRRPALLGMLTVALLAMLGGAAFAAFDWGPDAPALHPGTRYPALDEESEKQLLAQDREFVAGRTAGDNPLDVGHAGQLRAKAAHDAKGVGTTAPPAGPATFNGAWAGVGPAPVGQIQRSDNALASESGRIGALAIRPSTGRIILGGAQGGIWTNDGGTWIPRTNDQETQAMGALAVAPSDDAVVYAGTGEGALSGDSYFGNGVLRSTDGGTTWSHISGDYFQGVSISRIVVDPRDASHLYAAVLRGRGGSRRVTVQPHSRYGIWESTDGGVTWTLRREVDEAHGATDLEIDPQNPSVLYASFLSDAIYKSTDAGRTWSPIMNFGLPSPDFSASDVRFGLSLSHPSSGGDGVLYAGFPWTDANGIHSSRLWKSTNGGAGWTLLPAGDNGPQGENDAVDNYCDIQCSYDNVVEADPNNPNVVFAAGEYGYDLHPQSGGVFRSDDGGQTWKNLGWDLHPDFHAFAWDPTKSGHVAIGNDGGVLTSNDLGGRPTRETPLNQNHWTERNSQGLAIAQFSSIATNPKLPARLWGGTQDNGTQRKSSTSSTWFDMTSGDGGQVLVDPTDSNYVYGTYYGISPFRMTDGGAGFFTNQSITHGINLGDRSEFYTPWVMNQENVNQLLLGTYRVYRTNNAKAPAAGDVTWKAISPDLTSGCPGPAPNGGRGCVISALGMGGGTAAYAGTEEGYVWTSPDAQTADTPTWTQDDPKAKTLPHRPVATFAVDRSNYRTAYAGYNGFDAATPKTPGHVFKTTDGGKSWTNITTNLPDSPVNSLVLDPSYPNTIYAGTDVGPFVTYDGGAHWGQMGTGFPRVAIDQLDLDPSHRTMAAGTHGRSAFTMNDAGTVPALVLSKVAADTPVGTSSALKYMITLHNIGNAAATGVKLTDPLPADTGFTSASDGGTASGGTVTWNGLSIPAGASKQLTLTVTIAAALKKKVASIVNDGYQVTSAQGEGAAGSPVITPIAPDHAVTLAPATQTDAAHVGQSVTYPVAVRNTGARPDSYTMSVASGYPATVLDASCTTPLTTTPSVDPGATTDVCVKVTAPAGAANGDVNTATVKATSVADPAVSGTAIVKTIAVAVDTLLVDDDTNAPIDSQPIYKAALTDAGVQFGTWDLGADADLPANYLKAFKNVVWFTGNGYPGPLLPYESRLKAFLDGGGHLLVSGQDILDQAAGTTPFVRDYLHITWDGSETQNDKATAAVHGVTGSLAGGVGAVPLDHNVLQADFEDQVTPNGAATAAFTDDSNQADALQFAGAYKVVFLAFPMEAYGTAAQRADLVTRAFGFFGS
ncbi:MAG TPA: hypothetical protein VH276_02790 [Solirubrobacteraceae bacterium]|nr:hypothetical protein [Solirubrobacteraceae bacterium]